MLSLCVHPLPTIVDKIPSLQERFGHCYRELHRDPGAAVGGQMLQQHSLCGHLERRVLAMARLSRTGVLAIAG